jgi:hypothetical protein
MKCFRRRNTKINDYFAFLLGVFLGQRFIKDNDIGLVLIYDVQGAIAGVQMAVSIVVFFVQIRHSSDA